MRIHLVQAHAMLKLRMLSTPGLHINMDDATATMVVKLLADEMTESELQATSKILDFLYKYPSARGGPAANVFSGGQLSVVSIKAALYKLNWEDHPGYTFSGLEIAHTKDLLQELLRMFDEKSD